MEGQHIQQNVPMSVPLEHEGAGDTSVIATVSEASLEWDAYADGGYDLLRENNSHGSAWMQFPNIHRMQPANCGNYSSVSPFSTTWIEHTSKIWKSSYPYTFYRTSFDDDFEDYKSCESEDDFYSCDSNESDVEEFQINFRETSQVNINIDTLTIQLKFTVSSVSLTQTNKTRSQAKITETTNFKDNNVFPQENAEMSAGKCSYYDEIRLNEATYHAPTSDSQLFTEYAEFDEQMNDNDDKELKPLVQPTSFHSNHAIKRLLDPFENAANVYNNYQLVSISPSGSDPDIDEPHFIVLCPNSNGNFVEDGEFILNEEYYDDSYIENTTNTSYQLTEKILESDNSFFGLSATSAVEKTPMHKHIRPNESGIDYLECSKMDITNQSEIIGDNDLLLEKDFPSMKIKFVDSMDSVIAYGITNASDVTKDALQTPDDMTDEDEGKTKDDETMLCNLKDDYVNRTLSPVSSQRPSSDESACSSDTIHCDEVNSISSMEDTELQDQLLTKPLEWKYNPIFIPKNEMNRDIENEASVGGMLMNAYPDVLTNNGSGGQNSLYKIVTENNQHKIVFPHSTDQKERNTADVGFRKLPEKFEVNEESLSSSYKEKTTITSDQSSENEFESDNSFFSLSACSSVENTQMHENGRSNEFTNYQECSKIHISDQSEIIGDNDLLPEKDPSSMEMKFVDSMKSIVGYGITNASDMTKDALQTPDDMTDEDEGKTKDDEKMLCNLKDDYVNRTLSSISSPRPSSDESACSSDTIHCDEINSISSMEDTELQDQLLTKPLEWKYNPIFIPKNEMNREIKNEASVGGMLMNGSGGQNSLYKIVTENNEHIIVSPHSTDQKERNTADTSLRKLPEEFEVNEESLPSSHKEKTTITSDQSLENEFESDSNFFSSSASSSVENTQMHEKGRSNEFPINYPECSKMDITDQSEIIGDNDLLPQKEFPSMQMKFVDNMKSIVSHGITNASDMTQDTSQMPDDLTDEDEGKTKDDEKMLCTLIDDYVTRTILSIRDELYREVKDIETGYHDMQYTQPSNNKQTKILEEKLQKQLNVEIPSPESESNTLETNNSLKHDKIAHQLYVEEESLYHKHDTENKPYEAFNVFLSRTETTVKRKVMSESYVENTYSGEDEESDALRYKNHPSDYVDFEKGFVSSSSRPSSDGSACSSDIVQCDEVNSIRSMEDTELQDELLTKPLEWNYNPIYPQKAMNSKIEKQASFEMIYPDVLTNNGSGGQNSLYKIDTENNQHIIVSPHSTDQNERNSADISFRKIPEELDENEESSSSSHKEKTTSTSDQSSESVSESDNSLFTSSASSSVENTPVQENGRANEFTIDYPEYSTSDISYQSEIISDNDLLPEKDYSTMKINSAYSVESVVAHGITNASDMRQDTPQMPDDLTDEDEGKTKDDEKILCNLIDDYVNRTNERNSADISLRKIPEELYENEESSSSSHKEKTTSTSDQSSESVSESDNSLFTSSASSSVENTPVQENGRSNEFTIDYPEYSTSDISYQSEIISDNDLLPEKDYSTMKINSAYSVESVVSHGITNVSDMRQDTLQMPDDLTDEDEGKTKDDEKILCNLIDDYANRTNERNSADISFRKIPEELDENEESSSSSHKEKTTSTSDQSSESVSESDNSLFTSSASSSVENTPVQENGRANEFTIDYPEYSTSDISYQSEIISDNDLLPEKDYSTMKINSAYSVESVVAHGIKNASDMRQDTLQMPDDLTDEDEGKTKDDEKILCNLIDEYVNRTNERNSADISFRKIPEELDENEESSSSSHKEKTTSTSDQSSESVAESDNSLFTSSASSSVENTPVQENGRANEFTIDYPEYSTSDISYQSEIISDNDLLPEKDYSTMKINSAYSVESVVAHGIKNASDMRQDTLQMPDDLTDEDEGKTKDDEKILCNLIDEYVNRTNERNSADISFRKIPEELDENEESSSSSHKEKTTSTSDQSSESVAESDNSLFTSSASSSVENTPVQENGRSNEFTIDYPEYSTSDISYQSEIISDNDLLPEKDYSTMKINSAYSVESVVSHGITNVSDMRQDTLQMPDDLTDEDEGKTKDDEKILCNLIDDYVNRTILSIRDELYREVKDIETEHHHMQYKQPSNNNQTKILEEKLQKQLNVEIPSPERKSNTLETNNSLTHDKISQQLYVEEESLYHKHDAENKPYEAFNVLLNLTATKVKPKVMSESYMNDTYNVEYHESDALRYKDNHIDYVDFEKGFVSSSPRPSSDESACSSDIVQCDEVNSIRSMENTELQDELLTKPLEWNYNPIYPKKAMNSKIEKQASFEMIYPDVLTNNGSDGQTSVYKIDTENNQHIIVSPHSTDQKDRNSADISFRKIPEELDENEESSSSSHKEKTTSTSDQSSENVSESDNSLFTSSTSSSVENTSVQENGRSNEFTIDYPEYSTSDISYQSEIISDNDLLPEKDYSTMKINSADNVESVVAHGITDVSDMRLDTLQMPDDLTDEDEGKTKDDEKILCNLIDDYVTRTILSIRDELYREVKDIETEHHHMQYKQPSNNKQTSILEEKLPKQLNVEIPSPESKSNTLETNNSLKHDRIFQQLYVEEESHYHKHDTENKPYEAFNVLLNRTATKVKPKVMSERCMNDIYSLEEEESDVLRYKDNHIDYVDFEKGFVSSSSRPSSDGSACSSDIVQCDEVNSIRSMEDTELQDELLTKPLEWNYNPIYPKKAMNSKIEKQASFEMIYPDVLTNNGSSGQNSLYKIDTENNQHIIVSPHSTDQNERNSADISFRKIPEELDENEESSSSSHKEKTTSTSDQSSESVSESDNSLFTSSASSSVENTPVQENGRSNEFTIDYPECSTSDISYQSEIISDNDLLPEKDYSTMKINSAYSVESVVSHGITNASDMRQDTLQMPDLTDEDEGKTKDDEKILCNLIDDYVTRTILSIRDELYREVKDIETEHHHMQYKQPSNNEQTKILEQKLQKQLNVEIPSPENKSNTLETNNSLKHEKISHQLSVKEESLHHKHDTENKPYEAFNVLLNLTETAVKPKVMSESYVDDTYNVEDEESDALRYKDHPSDYLDFEKGFVSSSPRPSSDGSACSTDIIQCDEVNSIRSMEDTELQDQLLTKPSEWKYIPMYIPKKEMKNKTEKEASFDKECTQSINGIECHLEFNPDTVKFDKNYTQISNQEDETNPNRIGVKYIDRKEYKIELANDGDTIRLDKECKHAIEQERKHGMNGTDLVLYLDPMRFDQKCKHTAEVEPHRSFNDITPVDRSYADWHDTKTDTASTKPLESKFNPTYIPKNALNFSKMSDNSLSKIPVYERCNSPTGSSSVSSSNIGIKVADLAKNFSSSQFDTRNSIRRNRNYCEDLDVSVTEISKTFDDSSDINTSQVRQMPKRQKGKQMEWKLNPIYIPQKAISSQIEKEATFDSMASNAYDVLTNNSSGAQNRIMDDASLDNLVPGVAASKTCIYSGNNSINGDPSFDNLVMKCDPDCTKLQKADKRDTIKNTLNVSKTSDNNLSKIPVYESCSSRTGSSNTGVKVADLAKMFSSSKLDIMNSMRRNRNACKELNVSVSEILKTFIDSSDINTSNVRQMPVRQKGKQMVSTSPEGRIHVQDERNVANKNQDAIVENVSNKHDELNVESKGNEVENSSFQSLNTDVDSIYTRYTSKDDKGYLATFLKRKHYSPVKLKYLHESKPVKIDHSKLRTIIKSLDQPQRPYSEEIGKRQMFSEADPNQTCTSDHPANVEESQKNLPSENKRCTRRANKSDDDDDDDAADDDEFSRFEY